MPSKTHGMSKSKLYKRWAEMKRRCTNIKSQAYKDYGGRGIKLCDEWFSFEPFHKWSMENGYLEELEIDRLDNNKGYYPENCRFVTSKENCRNRRSNVLIEINGVIKHVSDWALESGLERKTISHRLKNGITGIELLNKPYDVKRKPQKRKKEGNNLSF